jgi:transposase-like protein
MKLLSYTLILLYEKYKKRCWACGSTNNIKWGKQSGKQRYRCKDCDILFTISNDSVRNKNLQVWFKKWVIHYHTFELLSKESGYSISTLQRQFYKQLDQAPILEISRKMKVNLLIDATYFSNKVCLVIYRDNQVGYTQFYRLTDGEWFEEIAEDLSNIISLGIEIESITCDGHKAILKAIKKICPQITLQRCIFHIQNMCRIWLTRYPKSKAGQELKRIVNLLHKIETHNDKQYWIQEYRKWYLEHRDFIEEMTFNLQTGRKWHKHKLIYRCYSVIRRALPNMFNYLDNKDIPKTTNGLESFFGHLKDNLSIHRGLTLEHKNNFIKWYLYFRNIEAKEKSVF